MALPKSFEMNANVAEAAPRVRHPDDVEFRGRCATDEHRGKATPLDVHPCPGGHTDAKQRPNPATPLPHA